MKDLLRQGDVLLEEVEKQMPEGIEPKNIVILAEGELTGHAHKILADRVYEWEVDGQRYVRVIGSMGQLHHEDHDPELVAVVKPDTTYRIIPQQECDLSGEWRKVVD